jgi:hypothetical protein
VPADIRTSSTRNVSALPSFVSPGVRLRLKCDDTRAETRFRLSAKRTSPFKSAGALVQSITGIRGVRISCINAGYTMFQGSVKGTGYPLHSPVSPSLLLPYVTVCHQISTRLYLFWNQSSDYTVQSVYWSWRRNVECCKVSVQCQFVFFPWPRHISNIR